MNLQAIIFNVFGGLGIFLYGMHRMSESLRLLAGNSLRRIIGALTNNRLVAVFIGLLFTTIVQSSSVTTVMVVGFVNSGLMTLAQSIGVILGANIGTTVTGWIIAIKITKYALPILGIGVGFYFFAKARTLKEFGHILFGIGMIFFGLQVMKSGLSDLKGDPQFVYWFSQFDASNLQSLLLAIATGCILTIMVQSSSATLGITIALAASGLLTFQAAAALILGENIGTTITAQLASIGTNINAKRAARAHLLFNVVGVFVMILIFSPYVELIEWLIPHDADFVTSDGSKPYIIEHIAATHTLFNVINVIIFLPLLGLLAKIVTWWIPDPDGSAKQEKPHLTLVDPLLLESPAIAIEQARQELLKMSEVVGRLLKRSRDLFPDPSDKLKKSNRELRVKILEDEVLTDQMQKEITVFLAKVLESQLMEEQSIEIRSLIRAADELESIADYCESLANYQNRCETEKIKFSADAMKEIQKIHGLTNDFFVKSAEALSQRNVDYLNEARATSQSVNTFADQIREAHLNRMNKKLCNAISGLIFSDIIVAFRRIKNHTFNLAETAAGMK